MRVELPDDILRFEKQPGQRLVNPEPKRAPGPLHVVHAEPTVKGVLEEVLIVVPIDKAVVHSGDEGGEDDERDRDCNQPDAPVPARHWRPTPAGILTPDQCGNCERRALFHVRLCPR